MKHDELGMSHRIGNQVRERKALETRFATCCESVACADPIETPPIVAYDSVFGKTMRPLPLTLQHRAVVGVVQAAEAARPVAVRYETTGPVAEIVARRGYDALRVYYAEEQVRLEDVHELNVTTRQRNFVQLGLECFAVSDEQHAADVNAMFLTLDSFLDGLVPGVSACIRVSHIEISRFLRAIKVPRPDQRALIAAVEDGNRQTVADILNAHDVPPDTARLVHEILQSREVPLEQGVGLLRAVGGTAATDLSSLLSVRADLRCSLVFDGTIHRSLEFYSGLTMQVDLGAVREVGGGGQYSDLVSAYGGRQTKAVGFALGASRVMTAMGTNQEDA